MSNIYQYFDLSLSRNDLPKSKPNTKSHFGTLISIGFGIYIIYYIISQILKIPKSYKISFHELFTDYNDNRQIITFGFKIPYDIIKYIIYDSNNITINDNKTKICDENLNILEDGELGINNYICFVNETFSVSNSTNHLIKIHFIFTNESFLKEGNRYTLSIKFKEPIINHESYDPFIYPENIKELNYFFEACYITRYNKYIKLLKYETLNEFIFFDKRRMVESKFLEDIDDTSKLREDNKTNTFMGSFRLSISKKKEIFLRTYPDIISKIGGHLSSVIFFIEFVYLISVRLIDNIRLYESVQNDTYKEKLNNLIKNDDKKLIHMIIIRGRYVVV